MAPAPQAMTIHPRVSTGVLSAEVAALGDFELDEEPEGDDPPGEVEDANGLAVDGGGAAVEEKESVVLSMAQNFCARFSAVGTLVLQLAATQV
jgi:hypothetical protein